MNAKSRTIEVGSVLGLVFSLCLFSMRCFAQVAEPYTTGYYYNIGGQLTGRVLPCVNGSCLATEYSYNTAGLVATMTEGALATWPGASAPSQWSWSVTNRIVKYTYDSMGRMSSTTVYSGSGAIYKLTQYSYDSVGRVQCVAVRMNPAGGGNGDACVLSASGSYGPDRITYTAYDPQNHPLLIYRGYGTPDQQAYARYAYSPNGMVRTIEDANNNLTTFVYDGFDRLSATEFPSKSTADLSDSSDEEQCTQYDNDNNCETRVTRDGQIIQYTYDALNRVTTKVLPGPGGGTVYYGYNLQNQRTSATSGSQTGPGVYDVYDGFGNLSSETVNIGISRTMSYQYDADGDRTAVTYPDGNYVGYDNDGLDRLWKVLESGSTTLLVYSYGASGNLQQVARGTGTPTTTYGYDGIQRLDSLSQSLATSTDDVAFSYQFNPANQITSETISNQAYDPLTNGTTANYSPNGLNEYSTVGGVQYTYDGRGNLTSDGVTEYTYDVENRLLSASGTDNATLTYDPLGRLYSVTSGSATTTFVYDGDRIAAEYNGSGSLLQRYVYGESGDDPVVWYEGSGFGASNRRYLLANQQGSIIDVTDGNGNVLAVNQYHPYGLGGSVNEGRFQFTGQAYIPEVGLYYYKARMYNPSLGRFMQTDPIGYTDDLDLYAYVRSDPIDNTDPEGTNCNTGAKHCSPVAKNMDLRQLEKLLDAQKSAMSNPFFQPSHGVTHCNQATCFVVSAMNAPMRALTNAQGEPLRADQIRANFSKPGSGYKAVPITDAQNLANEGRLVIVTGPGHVSTVAPDVGQKLPGRGPIIANVGYKNGEMRLDYVFPKNDLPLVRFYTPDQ